MNKKKLLLAVLLVLAVLGLMYGIFQKGAHGTRIIKEGDRAPEIALPRLNGGAVSLSSLRGKVVLVHFWATWCPPCVEEMPVLEQLYRSLAGQDVEILAVSVDEGGHGVVDPFIQRNKLTFPILFSPDRSAAASYGTFKFPETYVVDREGIVRLKAIGPQDWMHPENVRVIRELVSAK